MIYRQWGDKTSYRKFTHGEKLVDKSSHLSIFTSLMQLMMLLKNNFSMLQFYTLSKILISCRVMQLRFFRVETLLNLL